MNAMRYHEPLQLLEVIIEFYFTCPIQNQGTKIFQFCTWPAGRVTYNFYSFCKQMHFPVKSVCNKEHEGVICHMTPSHNSSQSTRPTGEELLILSILRLV